MKKVLVFGITENPGGIESVIMNYYRSFDKNKIQLDFLCNTEVVAYEDEIKKLGGKIFRITARSKNYFLYKKQLDNFFKKNAKKYSSIWVNVCSLANIDYLKYAKKYGIKKRIIHCHNSQNMDSKIRKILHIYNKLFIEKYATDFWSCADDASSWFFNKKIISSSKYLLVNNAIDTTKFVFNDSIRKKIREDLNLNEKFVIGNVGRFHFQKNQLFLLDIFYELLKINSNSVLLLVGTGIDEEKIKNKVHQLKIENNVRFLGVRNDVNELMQAMDVFLFPSLFEGLPVTLIEAQASDLYIFASNTISKNVKLIDKFEFLSLDESPKYWAKTIHNKSKNTEKRVNRSKEIKLANFDIIVEAKKIQDFFERN